MTQGETSQETQALQERVASLEAALLAILEQCPATAELTAAHDMAQIANEALDGDKTRLEDYVLEALSTGWIDGYGHARDDIAAVRLKIGGGELPIPLLTVGLDASLQRLRGSARPSSALIERIRAKLVAAGRRTGAEGQGAPA